LVRLWRFQHPNQIVFDEVYFGNFTNDYVNRRYFFDIHPPLAKLLIFAITTTAGYTGDITFSPLGAYYNLDFYVMFRLVPIVFSSFVPVFLYFSLRVSMFSRLSSLVPSLLILFDLSTVIEGRLIITDGILQFFTVLSICLCCYLVRFRPYSRTWYCSLILTSVFLSCAISCKYTAFSLCFFVGFCQLTQLVQMKQRFGRSFVDSLIVRACLICFAAVAVFITIWAIHLTILSKSGTGENSLGEGGNATLVNESWSGDDWTARLGVVF
jgi:dolichyl-phosphate-mannose-protein mannosyltransferase